MVARRLQTVAKTSTRGTRAAGPQTNERDTQNYMDIKEFLSNVQPGKKVSRLKRYEQEINELKSKGYTDDQIRQWLAKNNVVVSREAVRRFAKKISQTTSTETKPAKIIDKPHESNAERIQKCLADQKAQASNTTFKHDKSGKQTE